MLGFLKKLFSEEMYEVASESPTETVAVTPSGVVEQGGGGVPVEAKAAKDVGAAGRNRMSEPPSRAKAA